MKKVLGPIISILTGALSIAFLSIYHLTTKTTGWADGSGSSSAWELIRDADDKVSGSIFFKVTSIIMIVLSAILIVYGLVYLLANLKVFKAKFNFKVLNDILLIALVVVVVLQLIALIKIANYKTGELLGQKFESYPAIGIWLNLGLSIAACLASIFLTKPVKNKSKKK